MKKKAIRMLSVMLAVIMLSSIFVGCSSTRTPTTDNVDVSDKVRFEGIGKITTESSSEIATRINSNEIDKTIIMIEIDNPYNESVDRPDDSDITLEEAQALLKKQRDNVKDYYSRTNEDIMNKLDLSNFDIEFRIDKYAPFVIGEFDRDLTSEDIENIYTLAESDEISVIYVKSENVVESEITDALDAIDATNIVTNSSTNGDGIVIGILDVGIVDEDNSNFDGVDLTIRREWWYNEDVDDHATKVAICALSVAPAASILSVQVAGEPSGEIEWMLDNGVNVINMSYGYTTESELGDYTSESAYCDYIARNNWVTFTGSAGNRGSSDALVTAPNGYNTITVGASSANNTARRPTSSYEENFNINFPNLVAPGSDISFPTFPNTSSGTSFAAPLVAGAAAVLMQDTPILVSYPEHLLSILMASTSRMTAYAQAKGFNDEVGTGLLNLENALVAVDNRTSFSMDTDNVGNYVSTKEVYLYNGDTIRIAFVSLVNNGKKASTSLVTDYDLYLVDSNGNQLISNLGTHNNEFVEYTVNTSGYYTIKIRQCSAKKTTMTDYCSYTYFID